MYRSLRPLLFLLPPEMAHALALRLAGMLPAKPARVNPATVMGLQFPNRIGLAAGFDKTGSYADALAQLGFGFVEIGTFTPDPQKGSRKPRLFRIRAAESLLNHMGFNNPGAKAGAANISRLNRKSYVLGINIGKGANTSLEEAGKDYVACLDALYGLGDYFAVNVSSPNTKDLRSLGEGERLASLLKEIVQARDRLASGSAPKPVVVKLSPDIPDPERTCSIIADSGMDGVIATNTALHSPEAPFPYPGFPPNLPRGGVSGKAIAKTSLAMLGKIRQHLPAECALIACGGIDSEEEARRRLDAGADLIQIYTGIVYKGPGLPARLASVAAKPDG